MQLELNKRRRKYPSLTSLIDVIFLLLLFFMLSSTFSKYSEVEISSGNSGAGTGTNQPDFFVQLESEEWRINGRSVSQSEALSFFTERKSEEEQQAIVRISSNVTAQQMVDAVKVLNQAEIKHTLVK